ncbi:MAG: gliding motility-associated C-terminal domain-containing protein [Bacteroidota bacterium]
MKKLSFVLFVSTLVIHHLSAQIVDPFAIRYQVNQKGGLVFLANTSVGCNCAGNNEMPPGGDTDNNGENMNFVDIDSDASTYMSSSDRLDLPNCSEILWAGLYWDALLNSTPSSTPNYNSRNQVKLSVNGGAYQNLTADELLDNSTGKVSYYCFKDITSIAQANPADATYRIGNVVTQTGSNTFGGWTIVVVYRNIYESMKNITVFDGLANINIGESVNIGINGFLTPPSGPISFELGLVGHDGDRGESGDQIRFNGTNISDALHPFDNTFNSTISRNGVLTPFRNPSYNNNLGHDANIYAPDNSAFAYIGNSATSASIEVSSSSENILTSVITSAVDIYVPDLRSSVSYTDLNAGTVEPGDILEYSITAKNIGSDVSINTFLTDTLDERLTYIPGSLQITFGPNSGMKTDAADADQAEFVAGDNVIRARIGTGANGVTGGSVVNSSTGADSTVIKFRVQLLDECAPWQCGPVLENKAFLFGTGQISGITNGNNGASDILDQDGCPSPESGLVTVNSSSCPVLQITYTDSLCVGETISLSFPNSTEYTFSWTGPDNFTSNLPNPTIPNAQPVDAGNYVLHVNYNGEPCIDDTIAPVFISTLPSIQLIELKDDSCYHSGSGSVRVTGTGNNPFTYSWTNGDADSLAQNLLAGTYTVTVTDEYGCTASQAYTVDEPPLFEVDAHITSNFGGRDISCFGANNGSIQAMTDGGVTPYDFDWIGTGETTSFIHDLGPGQYIVEVTDANGCKVRDTATLVEPDELVINAVITDVLCFGANTGAIDASVTGGTSPYTYVWNNDFETTEDISNLTANTYTVFVTDFNNCSGNESFTVNQPAASMNLTATSVDIICNGDATGSIDLGVSGGVSPYAYSWSNTATSQDLTNIQAGTYTVTVTDDNNCTETLSETIDQPTAINGSLNAINPVCQNDSRGSIDLTVSGGVPGYSFLWNNGEVTEDIIDLYAGLYYVEITDANGCVETVQATLTDPDAVSIIGTPSDVLCYGAATGAIDITPSNGTLPYSFDWSSGSAIEDPAGLPAGLYSVDVVDNNGCGGFISFIIEEPDTLVYIESETITDVLCFGDATGSINIEVNGGTPPYDYMWSNSAIIEDINSLLAGNYSADITDDNGCLLTYTASVDEPDELQLTETHSDVLCFGGSSAAIDMTTSGGTSPYTYSWGGGQQTEDLTNLAAGTYSLTVTDDNNCTDALSVTIVQPSAALSLSSDSTAVLCFDGNDGGINLTVSGGTSAYSFLWSNGETTEDLSAVPAGSYKVIVTDANSCEDSLTALVTQPASPVSLTASATAICMGAGNGVANVAASGGTPAYTYLWETGPGDTLAVVDSLSVGTYSVTVTDANGCMENIAVSVEQPEGMEGCVSLDMPNIFTPNGDNDNDYFIPAKAANIEQYHILIVNRWGEPVYEGDGTAKGWDGIINGKKASAGVYFWLVDFTDSYGKDGKLQGYLTLVRE